MGKVHEMMMLAMTEFMVSNAEKINSCATSMLVRALG
jgi:hypothetical protein